MDVSEAIKERRSIRSFRKRNIPERTIESLIEAATWAPSAGNIQPWEFIVVRDPEIKRKLAVAALDQVSLEEAPVVIVVCADEIRCSQRYGERGKTLYCIQDAAAAIQNMLLFACSVGLGSCWVGAFKEEEVRRTLRTPDRIRPVALVPVGYPNETPEPRSRRPLSDTIHYETF